MTIPIRKIGIVLAIGVIVLSLIGNIVLGLAVFRQANELKAAGYGKINQPVLAFRNLFLEKIILSSQPVDFNTRLEMETDVRNLNDPAILAQWETFTNATTSADTNAQAEALLNLLIQKTYY